MLAFLTLPGFTAAQFVPLLRLLGLCLYTVGVETDYGDRIASGTTTGTTVTSPSRVGACAVDLVAIKIILSHYSP
jgi:hypothetical protein